MEAFLEGNIQTCGRSPQDMRAFPLCRPLYKRGEQILTAKNVLDKHGPGKIKEMIAKKRKNPNLRANWEKGIVE